LLIAERNCIAEVLRVQGRTKKWLAEQMGCSRVTLHAKLREGFTGEEERRLVRILGVPHAQLFFVDSVVHSDEQLIGGNSLGVNRDLG